MSLFDRLVTDYNILKVPSIYSMDYCYVARRITRVIYSIDSLDQMHIAYMYCTRLVNKYNKEIHKSILLNMIDSLLHIKNSELTHGIRGEAR